MDMIDFTESSKRFIREMIGKKPTFREFKEIYGWVRNEANITRDEAIELACKITETIRSKD